MKINYLEVVQKLTLMDDIFMTAIFTDDTELTEFVLKIILNVDLKVESVRTQDTLTNLKGRGVRLDIHARSADGREIDIEIQRQNKGAGVKRARYNSSMLDSNALLAGEDFDSLPETYVIFITERDVLKLGEPIYFIERMIVGKNKFFNDAAHIVYVNNAIQDETPLGRLMHDLACPNPDEIFYKLIADKIGAFKKDKERCLKVSGVIEELNEKVRRETQRETARKVRRETTTKVRRETLIESARKMLKRGKLTLEEIAEDLNLSLEEVTALAAKQSATEATV